MGCEEGRNAAGEGLVRRALRRTTLPNTARDARRRRRVVCSLVAVALVVYAFIGQSQHAALAAPSSPGTINLFAGGNSGGAGGSPLNAVIQPESVAVDNTRHILYLSDAAHNKVFEVTAGADGVIGQTNGSGKYIDTDDVLSVVAGTGVDGSGSATNSKTLGDGGPATGALLSSPEGLAVDTAGNLYIGDYGDNRVRFVCQVTGGCTLPSGGKSLPQGSITTLAGTGAGQDSGDNAVASSAGAWNPFGVALDSSGNLLAVDSAQSGGGSVRFVCVQGNGGSTTQCTVPASATTLPKGDITTLAGTNIGSFGSGNTGDGGPATAAFLADPSWITVDSAGNYYLHTNGEIRTVNPSGTINAVTITSCSNTLYLDQLQVTPDGASLYVSAGGCGHIIKHTVAGGAETSVAGNGTGGTTGDGGLAAAAEISPIGVALDSSGNLFLTDTNRVREVGGPSSAAPGYINTVAGNGSSAFVGDGGPAVNAGLQVPGGLATDNAGNVYIAEGPTDSRVRFVCQKPGSATCSTPFGSVTGQDIATVAGNGSGGYAGDGGLATSAQVDPSRVALDPSGNLFISQPHGVRFVCMETVSCSTAFGTVASGEIITVAGSGVGGFSGDGGPAQQAQLRNPMDLASDSAGNLYIMDFSNERVRFVCMQLTTCSMPFGQVPSGDITTVVGTGASTNTGDGGPAVSASITPEGLALDQSGNLYVSTGGIGWTIRSICVQETVCGTNVGLVAPGDIVTIAGNGAPCTYSSTNTCGDAGPATSAAVGAGALAVDSAGNLVLVGGAIIRVICMVASCPSYLSSKTPIAQGAINTIVGTGTSGSSGDGHPANTADIEFISGLAVDGADDVFLSQGIADAPFVREVTAPVTVQPYATPLNPSFALTAVGSSSTQTVTLTNPTSSGITVSSIAISGSDFRVAGGGDHCSATTVAAGATCTVQVDFQPLASTQLNRTGTVTFTDSGGPTTTQTAGLVGQAPPQPTITAVSPNSGSASNPNIVTITGTNLQYVTSASFGGNQIAAVTDSPTNPSTTLTVTSPGDANSAGGTVDITVSGTGGTSATSSADQYTFNQWGMLRVTTPSGGLPSQLSLDGNYLDTFGTSWVHADTGSHQLCFSDVQGWDTPSCQNVTVTQGGTTVVSAGFTQRGFLQAQVSPAGLDSTVSVDGNPMDDYGVFTDLPVGSHQVCWSAVANETPPPCQNVTLTAGTTTLVTGTYTANPGAAGQSGTGMLRVTTNPPLASQISVDGIPRDTWGLVWLQLPAGTATHTVCFRTYQGYTAPACSTVTITAGQTTTVQGNFTQRGFLQATISPAGLNGVVSVDGIARDNYGMFTDVPVGSHTVCWGAVSGHTAPACQAVNVTAGATTTVSGTYQ